MNGALNIHPKVVGSTLAGAIAVLIIWILGLEHITVPETAAGALVVLIGGIGGYLSPILLPADKPAAKS